MDYNIQLVMLICATALFVTTGVLLIIRTMPSRDGIGWWVLSSALQCLSYTLGYSFFGVEETPQSLSTFYIIQMSVVLTMCIGMLEYVDIKVSVLRRLAVLGITSAYIISIMLDGNNTYAICIFVTYMSLNAFHASISILRSKESMLLLKAAALLLFGMGVHWLDYPYTVNIEWFVPIGFLIGSAFAMGIFFSLATAALLQFKKITNDSEQRAIWAAIHDPLTGLYNRSHLDTLYEQYKSKADSGKGSFVLLYIDLDGFKGINDTYGHKAGDVILTVMAKRLQRWLGKKGDAIRIGGDELVVVNTLRSDSSTDIIYGTSAAEAVLGLLEEPIIDGENVYNISGSIGGCYYKSEYCCMDDMLSKADELMYSAKNSGGRCVHFEEAPERIISVETPASEPSPESTDTLLS